MPYVQRRSGKIIGVYANAQPGYAEEHLADDHADVVAFRNPPATLPDLAPFQFWAIVDISGHRAALEAFAETLPGNQKIVAKAKLQHTLSFRRDNPLVEAARQGIGLTDAELDALRWTGSMSF